MQLNDTTNYNGLLQDTRFILGIEVTDTTTYPIKSNVRNINSWYRRANSWIWEATGDWEYDDSNWTNLPIATTDLVADQQDYELPSTAQKLDRVEVLNSNGDYILLKPFDKSMITDQSMSEYLETAGLPEYYDMVGHSIFLYPKPSASYVTTTDGLKAYFSRDIDEFAITDTTTEPGFADNFHRILSMGAAYDYVLAYVPVDTNRMQALRAEINLMKDELQRFYSSRHRNFKTKIIPRIQNEV